MLEAVIASASGVAGAFCSEGFIPKTYDFRPARVVRRARLGSTPWTSAPRPLPPIGTPGGANATRVVLLGSGELGREVAIEAMRLGCEVVACDRYAGAPAMDVAHRSRVLTMSDPDQLRTILTQERERPCAAADRRARDRGDRHRRARRVRGRRARTSCPNARAARLTMDREGIRRLAAEELGLATSPYRFCDSRDGARAPRSTSSGLPCVVKPIMSSIGQGPVGRAQRDDIAGAWAVRRQRAGASAAAA